MHLNLEDSFPLGREDGLLAIDLSIASLSGLSIHDT